MSSSFPPGMTEMLRARLAEITQLLAILEPGDASLEQTRDAGPGWGESEIAALERRLGAVLPPSYRAFLSLADRQQRLSDLFGPLVGVREVQWFREQHLDWIEAYALPAGEDVSEEAHQVYGEAQDSAVFRRAYLRDTLLISEPFEAVYLLNPRVVDEAGEWEAWAFANWYPGAVRCRSFAELIDDALAELRART